MEKYEVKITDEALKDMEKIYDYIANSYAIARKTSVNSLLGTIRVQQEMNDTDGMKIVSKDTQRLYKFYTLSWYA